MQGKTSQKQMQIQTVQVDSKTSNSSNSSIQRNFPVFLSLTYFCNRSTVSTLCAYTSNPDVANFPTATFEITSSEKGTNTVYGNLTVRGITDSEVVEDVMCNANNPSTDVSDSNEEMNDPSNCTLEYDITPTTLRTNHHYVLWLRF